MSITGVRAETPEETQHFETVQPDSDDLKGKRFKSFDMEYVCLGHFPCGYHMKPVLDSARHCISERAIGRTYHEIF